MEETALPRRGFGDVVDRIEQVGDGPGLRRPEAGKPRDTARRDTACGELCLAQRIEVPTFDHGLEPPWGAWIHDG